MNFLENIFFDVVIGEMKAFLDENGFKGENGVFSNENKSLKVEYDEEKTLYKLFVADITDGTTGEYALCSSYLFDEKSNKNDAVCVGIDFIDEAKKSLGIKTVRARNTNTELPSANSAGKVNVDVLTAKLLANYPELKDTYKEYVSEKGKYLYLDFGMTYFVPEIRKTLDENNKKALKKLLDMLSEVFTSGDRASVNFVIALLAAAVGKSGDRFKAMADRLEDCPLLTEAVNQEVAILSKNRKLQKALKFEA